MLTIKLDTSLNKMQINTANSILFLWASAPESSSSSLGGMSSQGQTDWVLLHPVMSTLSPHPPPTKGRGLSMQGSCQGRGGRQAQKCVAEKAGLSKCLREVRLVAPRTHIHTPHSIPSSWAQLQCECGCISRAWESQLCNEHFIFIRPSLLPLSQWLW